MKPEKYRTLSKESCVVICDTTDEHAFFAEHIHATSLPCVKDGLSPEWIGKPFCTPKIKCLVPPLPSANLRWIGPSLDGCEDPVAHGTGCEAECRWDGNGPIRIFPKGFFKKFPKVVPMVTTFRKESMAACRVHVTP